MKRIKDGFLDKLEKVVRLKDATVLEIGCGSGELSEKIAARVRCLTGVDPNQASIDQAFKRSIPNARFYREHTPGLPFDSGIFQVVLFTLSLHHIKVSEMADAISEAASLVRGIGKIVVLEPGFNGSYFDAEIHFGAGDGDERPQKQAAQRALDEHPRIALCESFLDETEFEFDSEGDFIKTMQPQKNVSDVPEFLRKNNYRLNAWRTISVFIPC